jgi:superfamily II DNA/RNA helicase
VSTEQTIPTPEAELTFADIGFAEPILRAVLEQGYTKPTPIQAQAMPHVLQGRDVMGAAQTGTGKTAAFVLPILQNILPLASSSASPARHPIRALVLTPTRELADQVADNAFKYAKYTDIRTAVVFGGVDMSAQTTLLRSGIELLIATPGRLLDHITQKTANLSQVQILILDEADRMLDMGFLPDLQRIIGMIPAQRQTLLFSATFSPEIKKLAQSYLRDPVTNAAADTVQQIIHMVPSEKKKDAVVKVLNARIQKGLSRQAIVFTNSRIGCSKLASALERSGIKAGAIHGDKSQIERMQILESFKKGTMDVLVATDVAARGLDIADMPCVINHELPFNAEDYVHRIGRTGRAGAQGDAIALVDPSEERLLADIEKLMNRKLVRMPVPDPSGGVAADPFFYMPYRAKEESSVATNATNLSSDSARATSVNSTAKPSIKSTAKPVGALLGGFKKKS